MWLFVSSDHCMIGNVELYRYIHRYVVVVLERNSVCSICPFRTRFTSHKTRYKLNAENGEKTLRQKAVQYVVWLSFDFCKAFPSLLLFSVFNNRLYTNIRSIFPRF